LVANGLPDSTLFPSIQDTSSQTPYDGLPYTRGLRARGFTPREAERATEDMALYAMGAIVLADHEARSHGTDPGRAVLRVADTALIDVSKPIKVEGNVVTLSIRGSGARGPWIIPARLQAARAPVGAPFRHAAKSRAARNPGEVSFQFRGSYPTVVFITDGGVSGVGDQVAIAAMTEIDQATTTGVIPKTDWPVSASVLREILQATQQRRSKSGAK
jgi:hypothetical protein